MAWRFEFDVEIDEDLNEDWDVDREEKYGSDPDGIEQEYWSDRI